jgi:hypothetical protein
METRKQFRKRVFEVTGIPYRTIQVVNESPWDHCGPEGWILASSGNVAVICVGGEEAPMWRRWYYPAWSSVKSVAAKSIRDLWNQGDRTAAKKLAAEWGWSL